MNTNIRIFLLILQMYITVVFNEKKETKLNRFVSSKFKSVKVMN